MKKLIAFPLVWLFYYAGDFISKIPNFNYSIYNRLIIWSVNIQDWSRLDGPWHKPQGGTIEGFSEDVVHGFKSGGTTI